MRVQRQIELAAFAAFTLVSPGCHAEGTAMKLGERTRSHPALQVGEYLSSAWTAPRPRERAYEPFV
jgi:hypothetical protein